jgi:hypothetical protein
MDLNHINLPASLVAAIYKDHLMEDVQQLVPRQAPASGIQYLGKNQKWVCLLVDYADDVHLPDQQLAFLTSILQACKLNLGDVAIVNCHRQELSFTELRSQLSCRFLISFGVGADRIGLHEMPLFSIGTASDCQLLYACAADDLSNGLSEARSLKSKLWSCLKQMFAV